MSHSHSQESAPGLFLKDCRLQKKLHSQDWLSRNFGKTPGRFGGERTVFSADGAGRLDSPTRQRDAGPSLRMRTHGPARCTPDLHGAANPANRRETGEKRAKPARPRATPRALHAGRSRRGAQLLALGLRGQSQPAAPAKGAAGRPAAGRGLPRAARGCPASPCRLRAGPPQEPGVGRPLEGGNGFVEV